ncbi:hypothetical protein ACSBR1_001646 [Camellia fascicularis]
MQLEGFSGFVRNYGQKGTLTSKKGSKGIVFRPAAVAISALRSSGSNSEAGTLAREEALATIQMGYALGIKFNGQEDEAVKMVTEMELKNKRRIRSGVGTAA